VARVAEDGEVTPVGVGNAVITVTTNDQGKTATVNVSITELVAGQLGLVNITEAEGWLETLCVKWDKVAGAERYTVEYQGTNTPSWTKIDDPLIREYDTYYRADILGLAAGNYTVRVQPFNELDDGIAVESSSVTVTAHDRSGFAFSAQSPHKTSSGAYNENGTLKAGAQVLYLTAQNTRTVTLAVKESASKTTTGVGIGKILSLRQKGYDQTPLAIRFIGMVKNEDISDQLGSNSLLQVKGKAGSNAMNITVEGVGDDTVLHGWGLLVRNAGNVEIRNLGLMMFPEDGVSLDTDNQNIWVHNCDFFYGKNGGGDKKKGDGALDTKKSGYSTFSYNHFWDSGKSNLLGNGTESPENLTYHHNWYDHSDSRHPRVRFHTVHVYNNYYDGVGKYGIGATRGSSVFAEANYFRNTKKPMLISMQGSDIAGGSGGTFSSEAGGIIKAFGNYMDVATGAASNYRPWSGSNTVEFDAYPVTNRSDTVPATVQAKKIESGYPAYNNFDTAPTMYTYTPDTPPAARDKVIQYAGRYWHGDFSFTFTDAMDALVDDPMPALQSAINAYKSGLVSIQGGSGDNGGGDPGNGGNEPPPPIEGTVICTFTSSGGNNPVFSVTGSTSNSKGTVTVNGTSYSWCLKMESGTNVSFTTDKAMTLFLAFGSASDPAANKNVKIDGTNRKVGADATLTVSLGAGTHTIQKGDTMHLFYISLTEN
jgi:pectate lyase